MNTPTPLQIAAASLRGLILIGIACCWFACSPATSFAANEFPWLYSLSDKQDAALRSCAAASLDRLWAVGDRGLAMRSIDGGKSWQQANLPAEVHFHQVAFADSMHGFIAGGFIWPVTNRSDGCLLRTEDGGETWKSVSLLPISRITGIQIFSKDHLLVWGDWSSEQRGALLESTDGGVTFQKKEVPCAQITATAWLNPLQGVVVDRLSRVFVTQDGSEFQQLQLRCSPLSPLRNSITDGQTVWLCGDHGQLYKTTDLKVWEQIHIATFEGLETFLSLTSISTRDNHVWITTNLPGLLFSSSDGESFTVHKTETAACLNAATTVSADHVIAVGDMANIVETRNNGLGWWNKASGGNKLGLLVISPKMSDLALDALVHSSLGQKQHAGAVVLHAQHAMELADAWPGPEQRLHAIAGVTCSSWSQQLPEFPIGALSSPEGRASDVASYDKPENGISPVEQKLIFLIRALRPDVVVISAIDTNCSLSTRATAATLQAIQLAADPMYKIQSKDGFYELASWRVQRTMTRTARRTSNTLADWSLEPTEILGETGLTTADRVRVASGFVHGLQQIDQLIDRDFLSGKDTKIHPCQAILWNRLDLYGDYWNRSGKRRTNTQSSSYHAGILLNDGSKRRVEDMRVRNLQVLMASIKTSKSVEMLINADRSTEQSKRKWLLDLQTYLDTMSSQDRARLLLELSLIYLGRGDWDGWCRCEEFVLSETGHNIWKDIAQQIGFQIAYSQEFMFVYDRNFSNHPREESFEPAHKNNTLSPVQPAAFVSPFESEQNVAPAIHTSPASSTNYPDRNGAIPRTITTQNPIGGSGENPLGFNVAVNEANLTNSTAIDNRRVSLQNNSVQVIQALLGQSHAFVQNDLRNLFSVAAFEKRVSSNDSTFVSPKWSVLAKEQSIFGWSDIAQAETQNASNSAVKTNLIPKLNRPPMLDGKLSDAEWNNALTFELTSAWADDLPQESRIRIAADTQFLYLGFECPLDINSNAIQIPSHESKPGQDKSLAGRDNSPNTVDHLAIRLDIDRDYQSYFEFVVCRDGTKIDSVNQFLQWNPKWYVAQMDHPNAWVAELAIPFNELGIDRNVETTLAINAKRQIPGVGVQTVSGTPSDNWLPQTSQLVRLNAADSK